MLGTLGWKYIETRTVRGGFIEYEIARLRDDRRATVRRAMVAIAAEAVIDLRLGIDVDAPMGRSVIKHVVDGTPRYLIWSTVVDAPITFGMTKAELVDYWDDEYGRSGVLSLEHWLSNPRTLEDEAAFNRAGKDETTLTIEQLVEFYFVRCDPDAELPMGTREG